MSKNHSVPTIDTTEKHQIIVVAPTPTAATFEPFIKLYGRPPPPSDTRPTINDSVLPSPDPNVIVDVLDTTNEEPFTLESLESLIKMHWELNLDFIIARVTTVDPDDETRLYYSHYAAHHINKVLFRTQPEQGLLHRMKAKNPLNNMTIVGDVHYYVVKAKSQPKIGSPKRTLGALVETDSPKTTRSKQIRKYFRSKSNRPGQDGSQMTSALNFENTSALQFFISPDLYEDTDPNGKSSVKISGIRRNSFDDAFKDETPHDRPKTKTKELANVKNHRNVRSVAYSNANTTMTVEAWMKEQKEKSPVLENLQDKPLESPRKRHTRQNIDSLDRCYEAHYYASDDDYLMHALVRQYFQKNVVESTDAILFTIQTDRTSAEDHPALTNLALFFREEPARSNLFKKQFKYLILAYVVLSFVILKFCGNFQLTDSANRVRSPRCIPAIFLFVLVRYSHNIRKSMKRLCLF